MRHGLQAPSDTRFLKFWNSPQHVAEREIAARRLKRFRIDPRAFNRMRLNASPRAGSIDTRRAAVTPRRSSSKSVFCMIAQGFAGLAVETVG